MAFTPISGTAGRLRVGLNVNVAGLKSWKLSKQVQIIPVPHFETTADGDGLLWPVHLIGLAGATGSLEGWYDTDATLATEAGTPGITVGAALTADLIFVKGTPFGYSNVAITITGFEAGTNVENQAAAFTAQFTVNGIAPKATTVS